MDRQVIRSSGAPQPTSAYSQAIRHGDLIITSGYLGTHPDGSGLVSGGFAAEMRRALENIRAVLEAGGSSLRHVMRTTIYLIDVGRFSEMDRIYREFFEPPFPARSTVGVASLWGGAQISVDVTAACPEQPRRQAG